ncbi:MAG TPA: Rne/Rng family ribonuclease [Thermoanaerobaculia bacterium]|nr:Rne/Rng family ribonuclease [Thermoanaerobaculia bacterium]
MSNGRKMLVESDPHQTRIAVLEDDRLTEIFVERHRHRGIVGNVYKGRVTRVLPGMQAAFVDIGLERDAFLYVSDVEIEEVDRAGDLGLADDDSETVPREAQRSIDELLKQGQELLVQVVKDPLANKGARVTTHVTLPGRYLVLLPSVRHFGVSRRIEEEAERERLLALVQELGGDLRAGLIVRTVGEGRGREEFEADHDYLAKLWASIEVRGAKAAPPCLLHQEQDLAVRTVRDLFSHEFSVLWVDGEETYERIVEFLDQVQPSLIGRVKLYSREGVDLFERFGIESQIEAALRSKVWLKSGGYIVINPTEALVAIDVNTGRFVGKTNLEETVLKTNLEAVGEIVRQIRLRDLGGIIVLDLIDMAEEAHRLEVFAALEEELRKDRSKTKVLSISEFGLVEITRKRARTNLERLLTQPCPYCQGSGRIRAIETICLKLRREVLENQGLAAEGEILLRVHPDVARALQGDEREILAELELALGAEILIQADPSLHHERFDVVGV